MPRAKIPYESPRFSAHIDSGTLRLFRYHEPVLTVMPEQMPDFQTYMRQLLALIDAQFGDDCAGWLNIPDKALLTDAARERRKKLLAH